MKYYSQVYREPSEIIGSKSELGCDGAYLLVSEWSGTTIFSHLPGYRKTKFVGVDKQTVLVRIEFLHFINLVRTGVFFLKTLWYFTLNANLHALTVVDSDQI